MSLMAISVPVAENATPSTPHTRDIRSTRLPNGLLVLTERMPHLRSVSMGVWLDAGSRDETPALNGISHFLEHMVFKGTTTRSAQQFAREADALGGNVDAFTGKETVCFSIKVLDENVPAALDLLTDLVLHPTFAPEDIVREQGVILEEIKMDEDNPDYLVHELFTRNFWPHDALGRSILGTAKTVSSFNQQLVLDEYARRFTPANMIFAAAGNLQHDEFLAQVEAAFDSLTASSGDKLCARRFTRCEAAHHAQEQEISGTGAALPRSSGASGSARGPLRGVSAELDSGRRDEFAALPVDP